MSFRTFPKTTFRATLLLSAFALLVPRVTSAATDTYTDGTTGGLWSNAGNWSGGVPIASSGVVFANSFANTVYLDTGTFTATSLTFNGTGTSTLLGGTSGTAASQTLSLTGGFTVAATAGAVTFGSTAAPVNLSLTGSQTFVNNSTTNASSVGSPITPFGTSIVTLLGNGGANNGSQTAANSSTSLAIDAKASGQSYFAGGTVAGSTFNYAGNATLSIYEDTGSTGAIYTFGDGSTSTLNRVGRGVLEISTSNTLGTLGSSSLEFKVAGVAPTLTNGMVDPTVLYTAFSAGGNATFLTYGANGFAPITYTSTVGTAAAYATAAPVTATPTNTVAVTAAFTATGSSSVYALQTAGAITQSTGQTINIGNGVNPAGLILNGGTVTGGTIAFGSSEGIIYTNSTGNTTISAVISGTNGITKTQYQGTNGSLTLTGLNTYSGTTTVDAGGLYYSNAASQSLGAINGLGIVANTGAGNLTFTQVSGNTYTLGQVGVTGTGVLNIDGNGTSITNINAWYGTSVATSKIDLGVAGDTTSVTNLNSAQVLPSLEIDGGKRTF